MYSGGGVKEPAQPHRLLNGEIQNGLSPLRRGYHPPRTQVSPAFVTVSPQGDLKVPLTQPASRVVMSCHPEAVPREKRGRRALALRGLLLLPSAFPGPSMKKHLFCRMRSWGKDNPRECWQPVESGNEPRWPWRGRPTVGPVSASCVLGKITKTFWQKGRELLGRFPALFVLTLASLALQARFHNSKK